MRLPGVEVSTAHSTSSANGLGVSGLMRWHCPANGSFVRLSRCIKSLHDDPPFVPSLDVLRCNKSQTMTFEKSLEQSLGLGTFPEGAYFRL